MKDDGSWIHGSRMKLDIGCWLMDHGWMGEAGFWTCPEALEWVVGGCKVVLRSWDASGLFWVKVSGGFGGGFAGRGPENLGMAPEEARAGARGGAPGRTASWEGAREPRDGVVGWALWHSGRSWRVLGRSRGGFGTVLVRSWWSGRLWESLGGSLGGSGGSWVRSLWLLGRVLGRS